MFIPMSYLLYKNQAQAGNFLISFVSIEGLLVTEVRPAPARVPPKSQARPSRLLHKPLLALQIGLETWDILSDSFFLLDVYRNRGKFWVGQMLIPHSVFLGLACLVSSIILVRNNLLLGESLIRRWRAARSPNAPAISAAVETLEEKLQSTQRSIRSLYCTLLLAVAEGGPSIVFRPWRVPVAVYSIS